MPVFDSYKIKTLNSSFVKSTSNIFIAKSEFAIITNLQNTIKAIFNLAVDYCHIEYTKMVKRKKTSSN